MSTLPYDALRDQLTEEVTPALPAGHLEPSTLPTRRDQLTEVVSYRVCRAPMT